MGLKLLKNEIFQYNYYHQLKDDLIPIISDIEVSCDTSIQTLNCLLDYEKLESGIMTLEKKELLVWPIIKDTVGPFQLQVRILLN